MSNFKILHAKPTAYNQYGETVAFFNKKAKNSKNIKNQRQVTPLSEENDT